MSNTPIRLLHETLFHSAEINPSKVALVAEGTGHTYSELADTSRRIATVLKEFGAQRGDRIALYMDNTAYTVMAIFGILMIGCVFLLSTRKPRLINLPTLWTIATQKF